MVLAILLCFYERDENIVMVWRIQPQFTPTNLLSHIPSKCDPHARDDV